MIANVRRIVRMPVTQLRHHGLEGIQHIEVGARVEIGCGQGCGRVKNKKVADANASRAFSQLILDEIGYVEHFALFRCLNDETVHRS